jgi:two-component system sensor histidine kinase CiaH
MRFGRRPEPSPLGAGMPTPGERLVRRTGAGLAVFTLALIAILLAAVGLITALAVVQMTDLSVDQSLQAAADNMLRTLEPTPPPTPAPSPSATPQATQPPERTESPSASPEEKSTDEPSTEKPGKSDESGGGESLVLPRVPGAAALGALPLTNVLAVRYFVAAAPSVAPTPVATPGPEEQAPGSSDTFFLVLDTAGNVLANPQSVKLTGLPDLAAVAVAAAGAEDWRTVTADGIRIRLLTEPIHQVDGSVLGVLQSGFKLTAYDDQKALILRTIVVTSLVGLLGAALVTLVVTRRAMSPIRTAFDAERRFVAAASHELKTPVAIVRASAEILQREELVRPEGEYLVDDVLAESDRLGRLVGDLLALASAEAGQISISTSVFDMRALVDEVVDRVHGMAAERGVTVEATQPADAAATAAASGEALLVNADRERMLQLLMIYIDNAIDHSPQQGIVRVGARAVDDGGRTGQRVIVEVVDQGPGVPVADRERIFEPFARVSGRRRTTGTTGLGLAIARILAARQNATLAVRDAPGGGSSFSVSLARRSPDQT